MPSTPEDLLRPSLSRSADVAAAPYGNQSAMLTAFFGGPIAAVVLFVINTWRLRTLRRDAIWLVVAALTCAGWFVFLHVGTAGSAFKSMLDAWLGSGARTILHRLVALAIFGLAAVRHRGEQRSTDILGMARPNPWGVCIGLIALGWAGDVALARWWV